MPPISVVAGGSPGGTEIVGDGRAVSSAALVPRPPVSEPNPSPTENPTDKATTATAHGPGWRHHLARPVSSMSPQSMGLSACGLICHGAMRSPTPNTHVREVELWVLSPTGRRHRAIDGQPARRLRAPSAPGGALGRRMNARRANSRPCGNQANRPRRNRIPNGPTATSRSLIAAVRRRCG